MKETNGCPDLEQELAQQDREIYELRRRVEDLETKIHDLENELKQQPPPHYLEDWR